MSEDAVWALFMGGFVGHHCRGQPVALDLAVGTVRGPIYGVDVLECVFPRVGCFGQGAKVFRVCFGETESE